MAEVLLSFEVPVRGADGRSYHARVCGRPLGTGERWEGWIEFSSDSGGAAVRTQQESVQPHREALVYWATGLGDAYLEGALERALTPSPPSSAATPAPAPKPAFDGPAGPAASAAPPSPEPTAARRPRAVLDPFHVYGQGEDLLRQELAALSPSHLRNIVRAHDLADEAKLDLQGMSREGLADLIVAAVKRRA